MAVIERSCECLILGSLVPCFHFSFFLFSFLFFVCVCVCVVFKTHRILLKTTVMLDVLVWISMISVLVFASRYQETVSYNVTLGYAFILYVLGFIFYFAAGVVTMVALSRYETK
eukprot:Rmarinus@m.6458